MKYNNYTSYCNRCYAKGYHKEVTPCLREYTKACKHCWSTEYGKLTKCKGTNVLIDYSDIAKQFIPYFESKKRIKVKFHYGEIKSGTVGMTSGWKPVFLLMLRSNSTGSSYTLSDKDEIL